MSADAITQTVLPLTEDLVRNSEILKLYGLSGKETKRALKGAQ